MRDWVPNRKVTAAIIAAALIALVQWGMGLTLPAPFDVMVQAVGPLVVAYLTPMVRLPPGGSPAEPI